VLAIGLHGQEFTTGGALKELALIEDAAYFDTGHPNNGSKMREAEIQQKLVEVLLHKLSVGEFADWLSVARSNMHQNSPPQAQALASSISLLLYQHFDGYLKEPELRLDLLSLIDVFSAKAAVAPVASEQLVSESFGDPSLPRLEITSSSAARSVDFLEPALI
jgi:hypothetical protein